MQNLDDFRGRDFRTVFSEKPFKILFHDMTKLRIRLEHRDVSIPISILLLGVAQLLARKEFSKQMCFEILGRDWGYPFVVRLLLECDDVCLKSGANKLELVRIPRNVSGKFPVKPPPNGSRAENPVVR
jgi:hypothetical protein